MDGLFVVDKPAGPTSHDVVARVRRILRERRVGHTGTLDPIATGVLPLVVGRATRLARFMSAGDKTYEAVIELGYSTDTGDATGARLPRAEGAEPDALPSRDAIDRALDNFRGTFLQQPPAFSAKKIEGTRSYKLARKTRLALRQTQDERVSGPLTGYPAPLVVSPSNHEPPVLPEPASVTVHALELVSVEGDRVTVRVECSAGFYIRSLAHDLGERLGTGAHLASLRRTKSADCTLEDAVPLDDAERDPDGAAARLIPLSRMLPRLAALTLTPAGSRMARHGRELGPAECESPVATPESREYVRLLDPSGDLVAIARPAASGLLHPFVVLG